MNESKLQNGVSAKFDAHQVQLQPLLAATKVS